MHRPSRDVQYDRQVVDGSATHHPVTYQMAHVVLGVFLFIVLALPSLYLLMWGYPTIQPYDCSDWSIDRPMIASLGTLPLLLILFIIPVVLVFFVEIWRYSRIEHGPEYRPVEYNLGSAPVTRLAVRLFIFLGYFFLGVVFLWMIVDICRYAIGRPKPYFAHVCNSNLTCINGMNGWYGGAEYCHNNNSQTLKYARMSFPSWPAAFAWHNMVWVVIYLQARVFWTFLTPIFRPVLQFVCLVAATCVSVMQIRDLQYHVSDVIGGALIGTLVALLGALFVVNMWRRREWPAHVVAQYEEGHYRYPDYGAAGVQVRRDVNGREEEKTLMSS